MIDPFTRIITEPFRIQSAWGAYELEIGDKVEFYGQMPDKTGMVLIGLKGIAIWMDAKLLKARSVWAPTTTVFSVVTAENLSEKLADATT